MNGMNGLLLQIMTQSLFHVDKISDASRDMAFEAKHVVSGGPTRYIALKMASCSMGFDLRNNSYPTFFIG